MKHRDPSHFSEKNLIKKTISVAGTYTPDINLVNVFRIDASGYDTIIGVPKNPRDGQYIRLEIVSAENMDIQLATVYHINGAVVADDTHEDNVLLIMDGYYNADTAVWNMIVLSVLAA